MNTSTRSGPTVAIVGAGFSGSAAAVHLTRLLPPGARVVLLEQGPRFGRGVAYGTRCTSHWLNVPAGRLGLDPAHEAGFIDWLKARGAGYEASDFVPRQLQGDYLAAALQDAVERAAARGLVLERQQATVEGWQRDGPDQVLWLADGSRLRADQVVLATGHLPPTPPPLAGLDWGEPGLVADPWAPNALADLPEDGEVLVLGTGLTAIDLLSWLQDRGHQGAVTLLSRRGLLPQAHRSLEARPRVGLSPVAELGDEVRLRPMLSAVRRWSADAQADGRDWRDVMASLRGCTPGLWQRLPERDRQQFLRHLLPWWDTHRHRLAPGIHRRLVAAMAAGQARVAAGRVRATERLPDGRLGVLWQARGSPATTMGKFAAIVNCTGASTGLRRADCPLLASLRDQGVLVPDALDLGLRVDGQHRPLNRQGVAADGLYYVGPMLKAQWWEAIAIPELRVHARDVAEQVSQALSIPRQAVEGTAR